MHQTTRCVRSPGLGIEFEVLEGDTIIGPAIESGMWEEHESRLFRAHLIPGARVLDLGANVGWFSALAILAGCEVHAFEPVPHIADVCERNMRRAEARNGAGRGTLHRCAAGEAKGTARIALARSNFGDNRVVDGTARPSDMGEGELLTIDVDAVDARVEGPFRVIKIDTQGSEWLALRGAQKALAQSRDVALLFEFWPYALRGAAPERLLSSLAGQGFTIGKATAAPYPMTAERILRQAAARDPVKGGLDLYATRGLPFHVGGTVARARAWVRSFKEA